ncbi:hypothetical protein NDU88_003005 [Pleurodeles waltl]|uniref:Uncharacterized protein n=1 Tax=Pleurodeles waltl TaxID=8319 RepID=A0AAV7RBN8_PLEWA|nr:hypothetical protein NDU88_003005 [Pleurodeles waltl]
MFPAHLASWPSRWPAKLRADSVVDNTIPSLFRASSLPGHMSPYISVSLSTHNLEAADWELGWAEDDTSHSDYSTSSPGLPQRAERAPAPIAPVFALQHAALLCRGFPTRTPWAVVSRSRLVATVNVSTARWQKDSEKQPHVMCLEGRLPGRSSPLVYYLGPKPASATLRATKYYRARVALYTLMTRRQML